MFTELEWSTWNELSDERRLEAGAKVRETLDKGGIRLAAPELHRFGTGNAPVLQFAHAASKLRFSLVPGGSFHPGSSKEGWLKIRLTTIDDDDDWDAPALERLYKAGSEGIFPYGVEDGWSLESMKPSSESVRVEPLLVATTFLERIGDVDGPGDVVRKARAIASKHRFSLPSTLEAQWFTDAGAKSPYYFGERVPSSDDREFAAFARAVLLREPNTSDLLPFTDPVGRWPEANRFGLRGLLAEPQLFIGQAEAPFVRGGAGFCYPWQGGGEWLWLPTSVCVPLECLEPHAWGATRTRPVVRLTS